MRWWTTLALAALVSSVAGAASAAEVAPGDVSFGDDGVTASLTGQPGDAAAGAEVFKSRKLGNCLACHMNEQMAGELFQGNVGPALDGVADRYDEGQLRAIVVNAKQVFTEETVMPGFYTLDVGAHVAEEFKGKTILSAKDVEDVVAYLETLKE